MERDFMPLSHVASLAFVLAVNPSVPAKSLKELIDLAKTRPGEDFVRVERQWWPACPANS
jgi:tripartite-type tricarboxylate transporter receptor subunit TctC